MLCLIRMRVENVVDTSASCLLVARIGRDFVAVAAVAVAVATAVPVVAKDGVALVDVAPIG